MTADLATERNELRDRVDELIALIAGEPTWEPTEGPGSGDDKYRFRPGAERAAPHPTGEERDR